MAKSISNSDNFIDSRDVIGRIEELQSERETLTNADTASNLQEWDESDGAEELKTLLALQSEFNNRTTKWADGVTLIADYYFVEYAQDFAEEIGAISRDAEWPIPHIDWAAAADELKQDYSEVTFDGSSYWVRS